MGFCQAKGTLIPVIKIIETRIVTWERRVKQTNALKNGVAQNYKGQSNNPSDFGNLVIPLEISRACQEDKKVCSKDYSCSQKISKEERTKSHRSILGLTEDVCYILSNILGPFHTCRPWYLIRLWSRLITQSFNL